MDVTGLDGIPVTTVARTALDLAEVLNKRQLERALEQAERQRVLDLKAINDVCSRSPGRRGVPALIAAVQDLMPEAIHGRSELERLLLETCREHGIPVPALNVVVAGLTVDALWRDQRLVVELDSRAFHLNAKAFEEDREREAVLLRAGYRVLRVTWRRLTRKPHAVASDILALLAQPLVAHPTDRCP